MKFILQIILSTLGRDEILDFRALKPIQVVDGFVSAEAHEDVDPQTFNLVGCLQHVRESSKNASTLTVNRKGVFRELVTTSLRQSPTYYLWYCVLLNTAVASVLPLVALVSLNIATVRGLKRMQNDGGEDEARLR